MNNLLPEMYLKQPGYTYNRCITLTKNDKRIKTFSKMN